VLDLRPAGILNGITPITGGADMVTDISKLAGAVAAKAGNGGMTFVASPTQATTIALQSLRDPWPVLVSTALPAGTVLAVANNAIVFAADDPAIDITSAASMQMDTAPVPVGGTAPVHALFQKDVFGLRLRWPISWAVRDPAAVAFVQGATWPT